MKKVFLGLFLCTGILSAQPYSVTVTDAMSVDGKSELLFFDTQNADAKALCVQNLSKMTAVYSQNTPGESNRFQGPIMVNKQRLYRDNAGKDLGIGVGLCFAGCLFVLVAGEETSGPNGGYQKTVTGAPACIVGAVWVAGLVLIVKGVIELFMPGKNDQLEPAQNNENEKPILSTKTIMAKNNMLLVNKKIITAQSLPDLSAALERFALLQ